MCEPATIVAIAGLAVSAAATGYSVYSADQTVHAQNKINQEAADEGGKLADASFKNEANQARLRDAQEADAASQSLQENSKRAAQARENVRVSSGEAGVAGVSVDNLLADYYRQEGNYNDSVNENLGFTTAQTNVELEGFRSGALDRKFALERPKLATPSYLAAGVNFAGTAIQSYRQYRYDDKNMN